MPEILRIKSALVICLATCAATLLSGQSAAGGDAQVTDTPQTAPSAAIPKQKLVFPIIANYGGVLKRPTAVEQPRAGAKVVLDVTAGSAPGEVNEGLERAARLLNLHGAAGLQATDVTIAIVVHGDATTTVLSDSAYETRLGIDKNPNLPLLHTLRDAGVEIVVCGQALNYKAIQDAEVDPNVPIAVSALTALINKQADGHAFILIP